MNKLNVIICVGVVLITETYQTRNFQTKNTQNFESCLDIGIYAT